MKTASNDVNSDHLIGISSKIEQSIALTKIMMCESFEYHDTKTKNSALMGLLTVLESADIEIEGVLNNQI